MDPSRANAQVILTFSMRRGPADEGPCDEVPPTLGSTRVLERIRAEAASAIGRMMFLWYLHRIKV